MNDGECDVVSFQRETDGLMDSLGDKPKIRVVIADDDPIVRDGLRKLLLGEEDIQVVGETADGQELLQNMQTWQPDVILFNLHMLNTDGLTALQTLQTANNPAKVIMLTASEDENGFVQAMKLGCAGIVLRQTSAELIVKSIRKVHSGEMWLDAHITAVVMRQFATTEAASGVGKARERAPLSAREREIVALVARHNKNKAALN